MKILCSLSVITMLLTICGCASQTVQNNTTAQSVNDTKNMLNTAKDVSDTAKDTTNTVKDLLGTVKSIFN